MSEPDLAAPTDARWIGFTPPAVHAGVRAVFGYPLLVGSTCIGALNLCAERPGMLTDAQHRDALVVADVAARSILATQADMPFAELAPDLIDEGSYHLVVHQAVGMVIAQLGTDVMDAFLRLRAHAFASGRRLSDVAQDIVDRRLRLDP